MPSLTFAIVAPLAATMAAALVESIPIRLDDNISVPFSAGVVMWLGSLMDRASIGASATAMLATLPWAVVANAVAAWAGYRARSVSVSGAVTGFAIGVIIYAGAGGGAWVLLMLTFLLASVTSRLGLERKTLLGIAEERGGRRGAGNAIANCGVAVLAAVAAVTTPYAATASIALVAALTAGGSDTVASEIGKAWGRSTFLVTSLEAGPAGNAWSDVARRDGGRTGGGARARGRRRGGRAGAGVMDRGDRGRSDDGGAGRKRAWRDARRTGYSQQRHAQLHQHRGGRRRHRGDCVKIRAYIDLGRPFTLVAPALGFISGALTAVGAAPREAWAPSLLVAPIIGAAMAALLNAGNNALNQIYDLDIDRVNKPKRPLPSGRLTIAAGVDVHGRDLRRGACARLAGRAGRPPRVLLAGRRRRSSSPTSTRCRRCAPSGSASGRT